MSCIVVLFHTVVLTMVLNLVLFLNVIVPFWFLGWNEWHVFVIPAMKGHDYLLWKDGMIVYIQCFHFVPHKNANEHKTGPSRSYYKNCNSAGKLGWQTAKQIMSSICGWREMRIAHQHDMMGKTTTQRFWLKDIYLQAKYLFWVCKCCKSIHNG